MTPPHHPPALQLGKHDLPLLPVEDKPSSQDGKLAKKSGSVSIITPLSADHQVTVSSPFSDSNIRNIVIRINQLSDNIIN